MAGLRPCPPGRLTRALCDVDGLESLGTLLDVELDGGAFGQGTITIALNRRKMYEHIFSAGSLDKTVSFGFVKPLHYTLFWHD